MFGIDKEEMEKVLKTMKIREKLSLGKEGYVRKTSRKWVFNHNEPNKGRVK